MPASWQPDAPRWSAPCWPERPARGSALPSMQPREPHTVSGRRSYPCCLLHSPQLNAQQTGAARRRACCSVISINDALSDLDGNAPADFRCLLLGRCCWFLLAGVPVRGRHGSGLSVAMADASATICTVSAALSSVPAHDALLLHGILPGGGGGGGDLFQHYALFVLSRVLAQLLCPLAPMLPASAQLAAEAQRLQYMADLAAGWHTAQRNRCPAGTTSQAGRLPCATVTERARMLVHSALQD